VFTGEEESSHLPPSLKNIVILEAVVLEGNVVAHLVLEGKMGATVPPVHFTS